MKIISSYKKEDFDSEAIKLLAYTFFFAVGTYGSKAIVIRLGFSSFQSAVSLLWYLYWLFLLVRLVIHNRFILKHICIFEGVYIMLLMVNFYAFPNTQEYYAEYIMFLRQIVIIYLPMAAIVSKVNNFENWAGIMRNTAISASVFMIVAYLLGYTDIWEYQYLGVQISPFALILWGHYIKKQNIASLIWFFIDVLLVFMGGRQSIIIVLVGSALLYYINIEENKKRNMLNLCSFVVFVTIIYSFSGFLINILSGTLSLLGINSRTLNMLVSGELISFSTRNEIFDISIAVIKNNKFQISGLFSDRYYIREYYSWMAYPHNILLEIFIDFGIILGTVIIILIIALIIRTLSGASKSKKELVCFLIVLSLIRLLVSSSFMIEGMFYLLIGIMFSKQR